MNNLIENDIVGTIGTKKYHCTIKWHNGTFIMDEPIDVGGNDEGPDPYTTLLAALAGCTLSTLRMYIDRKGWIIPEINVQLNMTQETDPQIVTTIKREISFSGDVTGDQKDRLLTIATKCPVSKILENKIVLNNIMKP
ncbi:MAG: OsmC family protein [Ginsengibacter sp.]